jgi:hypothetical protein
MSASPLYKEVKPMTFEQLATEYVVWEPGTDKAPFQKRARLLQSLWRENQGYAIGTKDNSTELLGSMLAMPWAEETLANYLTPSIQQVVREEEDVVRYDYP